MRVIDKYRHYLESKAERNAGVAGRMIDLRGQALLWMLPAMVLGVLDYLIKITEPFRTMLYVVVGVVFIAGFVFVGYVFLFAGAKIDDEQAARDRRDNGI